MTQSSLIFIAGPTAVGKSDFSLSLAEKLDGEIINADSVQCYQGLNIGSAKPGMPDISRAPHHLYDLLSPKEQLSIGAFLQEFDRVVSDVSERGKRAIVVGGSGMYVTALFYGLATGVKSNLKLRMELEKQSSEALYQTLLDKDPERAKKLHQNDRNRVIRAIEIATENKAGPSKLYDQHQKETPRYGAEILVMVRSRSELYQRIDQRVKDMFDSGLVPEVEGLLQEHGPVPVLVQAIGYKECYEMLEGRYSQDEAIERISKRTRNLAKRQFTYWRNQPKKSKWNITPGESDAGVVLGADSTGPARKAESRDGIKVSELTFAQVLESLEARGNQTHQNTINLQYLSAGKLVS